MHGKGVSIRGNTTQSRPIRGAVHDTGPLMDRRSRMFSGTFWHPVGDVWPIWVGLAPALATNNARDTSLSHRRVPRAI